MYKENIKVSLNLFIFTTIIEQNSLHMSEYYKITPSGDQTTYSATRLIF